MSNDSTQPDYGVDAPEVIRGFFLTGGAAAVASVLAPRLTPFGRKVPFAGPVFGIVALASLSLGTSMTAYGLRGKFNVRDRLLSCIDWTGDESVLDVGTGRGLLVIGAAKCLTRGSAVGIDIWNAEDLSGNTLENALANVRLEGVEDKVQIRHEDVRRMSFPDGAFDVILSLLCVHNIEDKAEQESACREIARVLKPGGTALIGDYINTARYAKILAHAGLTIKSHDSYVRDAYGPMRVVVATRPIR